MNNDLISREVLLKAMEEERQYLLARGQTGAEHILVHHCLPLIDNASTVDTTEQEEFAYNEGYAHGLETKRSQGEWERIPYSFVGGYRCSMCGCKTISQYWNFCPNCGADMRGDAE